MCVILLIFVVIVDFLCSFVLFNVGYKIFCFYCFFGVVKIDVFCLFIYDIMWEEVKENFVRMDKIVEGLFVRKILVKFIIYMIDFIFYFDVFLEW